MSNATTRNFAAGQGERDRRLARMLEGGMPIGSLAVTGEPGWDAFFGSLHDKEQAANAAGMGFRADLGSIGRYADQSDGGGRLTATDRAGIAGNVGLAGFTDANAARQLALKHAVDQERDAAIADAQGAYQQHVLDSVAQPAIEEPNTIGGTGANGEPKYIMRNLPSAHPLSRRQQIMARVPGSMVPETEAALAPLEQRDRVLTEAERTNRANERLATASTLSDDAIDQNARQYLQTGVMPVLGMKDPGNRAKILNRAAELDAGGNVAANKAGYKADTGSLSALQKQRDAVGAFESTALKNLDVFMDAAKAIPDTGSPALNKPLRALSEQGLGSAELAAYNAARRTVIPEFAKILANPGLSGQLSDSARKEVEEVLSGNATLAQTIAVANVLKRDAENRRTSYDDQLKTIRERIDRPGGRADGGKKETPEERLARLLAVK